MSARIADNFDFPSISHKEIEDQIDLLNASKAKGPFSIPIYSGAPARAEGPRERSTIL